MIRPLGLGGMAEVYLARVEGLEDFRQYYAVKRILPKLVKDAKFVRMFLDEARVTVALRHPNIVQVHDLG
ncbi:MAG: serine/threonine protein kinase, partial [Myxococcota bacterium]|nr:serine/threonine protein kinase [Myxococcota bacterium]